MAKQLPGGATTLTAVLTLLLACQWVAAAVDMRIVPGWNGMYRFGRWAPVYITFTDDQARTPRTVLLEVNSPHSSLFEISIRQTLVIRDQPDTFLLYLPLQGNLQDTVATLRDAKTDRKLAEQSFLSYGSRAMGFFGRGGQSADVLIGVSGPRQTLQLLEGELAQPQDKTPQNKGQFTQYLQVSYLEPKLLPPSRQGYEALSILLLNAPDLSRMPLPTQQAITAWVEAGGRLLLWAGEAPLPPGGPIVQILPCQIGPMTTVTLSLADAKAAGLASRVEKLRAAELTPLPTARPTSLLGGKAQLYQARAGLGQVAVLSIDGAQLEFETNESAKAFWYPIIRQLAGAGLSKPSGNYGAYGGTSSIDDTQSAAAVQKIVDRLGDVPGVGAFNFSYIALVMVGMMLIVGPIDWLVLKKLRRQPWTWATTTFWIVLITGGALFVGRLFRSGQLYYRSMRIIEQVDGKIVDGADITGIYSPQTQGYRLACPAETWWEPTRLDMYNYGRRSYLNTIDMAQDQRGNRPLPMTINVWNLRFMTGHLDTPTALPAPLQATLKAQKIAGAEKVRIRGQIVNKSDASLSHVYLDYNQADPLSHLDAAVNTHPVEPGQAIDVDVLINLNHPAPPRPAKEPGQHDYYYQQQLVSQYNGLSDAQTTLASACQLKAAHTAMVNDALRADNSLICIYALGQLPKAPIGLSNDNNIPAIEQHWQVVRALVKMQETP